MIPAGIPSGEGAFALEQDGGRFMSLTDLT